MPHNDYLSLGNLWPLTAVPSPEVMRAMDQMASELVDGDHGGVWAPSSPIVIGGAGMTLSVSGTLNGVSTGPRAASGGGIVLGSSYLTLASARARVTVIPLRDFLARSDDNTTNYNESGAGIANVAAGFSCRVPSYRLHKGYTPTSVTLRMRVGTRPAAVPTAMPGFRITRVAAVSLWNPGSNEYYSIPTRANLTPYALNDLVLPTTPNGKQFRCTTAGTSGAAQPAGVTTGVVGATTADGSVVWTCETGPSFGGPHLMTLPRPATVDAYFNQGNYQDISFVPNNLGAWDSSTYSHSVAVADASGTNNSYHSLRIGWSLTTVEPLL